MKKYFFFPVFTLFLSLMLLAACDRSDQPEPADVADTNTPAVTFGEGDPDGGLTFRSGCGAVSTECSVTLTVTAGTADYTVCGMVYSAGTDYCNPPVDLPAPCGEAKGYRETFSSDTTFCMDYVYHPGFLITNNSTGGITVNITSSGMGLTGITIPASGSAGFEVDANCDINPCQ